MHTGSCVSELATTTYAENIWHFDLASGHDLEVVYAFINDTIFLLELPVLRRRSAPVLDEGRWRLYDFSEHEVSLKC